MKKVACFLLALMASVSLAAPPGGLKQGIAVFDGNSVPIMSNAVSGVTGLNVYLVNPTASGGGTSSTVSVSNFPASQPVTGTFWQATQPVSQSGTWTVLSKLQDSSGTGLTSTLNGAKQSLDVNLSNSSVPVTGTFWQATQPVSGTFWQSTQPVSLLTLPSLATGANTIGSVNVNGTVPVSGTFFQATQPVSGTVAVSSLPLVSGTVGVSGGGNSVSVSSSNALKVDGSAVTQPVSIATMPTTPVTGSFWQTTQPVSIATMPSTPVTGTFWQTTQPVSGSVSANVSGMVGVSGSGNSVGVTASNAFKVDGSATTQPVSGSFWQSTQPVSIATMPSTPVTGTFWQATQPVSLASVPALSTGSNTIGNVNINGTVPVSGTFAVSGAGNSANVTASNALKVDASATTQPVSGTFWQSTQPVSLSTLPALATGANTIGSVNVNGTVPVSGTFAVSGSGNSANVTASNALKVDGSAVTQPVSISSMPSTPVTGTFWQTTQPVSGTFFQSTQPVSLLSLPSLASGTNQVGTVGVSGNGFSASVTASNAIKIDGSAVTQPVSVATMPSTPVTGTFWQSTQPVSGTFWQSTQPVSLGSLPSLSAGSALIGSVGVSGSGNAASVTASNALKVDASATTQPVSGTFWQATQPVSGTFFQSTQPVSIATLPALATGSSTIGSVKITDGTNTGAVKAASTAAVAADPAQVVAVSPNNTVNTQTVAGTASATLTATGSVTVTGLGGGDTTWVADIRGTFSGGSTLIFESSYDGTNFVAVNGVNQTSNTIAAAIGGPGPVVYRGITNGAVQFRVRCSAFAGGDSIVITVRTSSGASGVHLDSSIPTGANTIGAVALNVASAASSTPIGAVSLGNTLGKTNVILPKTTTTTAVTANQLVGTAYTVTTGKTLYVQSISLEAKLTAVSATAVALGTMSLQSPALTNLITHNFMNQTTGSPDRIVYTFPEPIAIASATVIQFACTPSATTSTIWAANLIGYEK